MAKDSRAENDKRRAEKFIEAAQKESDPSNPTIPTPDEVRQGALVHELKEHKGK